MMKKGEELSEQASFHDGVSPIVVTETEEEAQFNQLWSYLVPPSGRAKTAQGEIIRINFIISKNVIKSIVYSQAS